MGAQFGNIDTSQIENLVNYLFNNETLLEINKMIAEKCDPYVPYNTGRLAESGKSNVTPKGIHYNVPYAEEQYFGIGINHNLEHHPKATAFWDKVMMQEHSDEVRQEITEILSRRARELYGK